MDHFSNLNGANGDTLLNTLKTLDIDIGNLNPDVIRSWFELDDPDILNLLNWICSSLSEDNVLLPYEIEISEKIEKPLSDSELEKAVEEVNDQYPNIFNNDVKAFEMEFALENLKISENHLARQEKLMETQLYLQRSLNDESIELHKNRIMLEAKCDDIEKECIELVKDLHEKKVQLLKTLTDSGNIFKHFENAGVSIFFNQGKVNARDNLENFRKFFEAISNFDLGNDNLLLNCSMNNTTFLGDVGLQNFLDILINRVSVSEENLIKYQSMEKYLEDSLSFLKNFSIEGLPNVNELYFVELNIESNIKQTDLLRDSLKQVTSRNLDNLTVQPKISFAKKQLDFLKSSLDSFDLMSHEINSFLAVCYCTKFLYRQEYEDLIDIERYFLKNAHRYAANNANDTAKRICLMQDSIRQHEEFSKKEIRDRFWKVDVLVNLLSSGVKEAHSIRAHLNNNIFLTMKTLFDPSDFVSYVMQMNCDTKILNDFLLPGSTTRLQIIPHQLKALISQIKKKLTEQDNLVKQFVTTFNSTESELKAMKRPIMEMRKLWVYFYENPAKMHRLIERIEEMKE